MAEINNPVCGCRDCEEKRNNEILHLHHPFYKRVDEVTDEVKIEQIIKGANKYDEPFNPASWTNKELVWHQLQELRDAQVYGVGLLERLEEQEAEIEKGKYAIIENCELRQALECVEAKAIVLENDLQLTKQDAEYWRLRAIKLAERCKDYEDKPNKFHNKKGAFIV